MLAAVTNHSRILPIPRHTVLLLAGTRRTDGRYHASVKIHADAFAEILAFFQSIAVHRTAETISWELQSLRFSPFARVRRQYLRLLREVNLLRRIAGFDLFPLSALKLRRVPVKVFSATPGVPAEPAVPDNGFLAKITV